MTLPRQWQRHALALVEQASPLEGEFFRSVELAYAHPDDVVSGEGTRSYGGRFVRRRTDPSREPEGADDPVGPSKLPPEGHSRIGQIRAVGASPNGTVEMFAE